ncbi:MAG: hypothetical protein Q8L86_15995 [Vicinamibacterales bacterium]|nr:hypothetical protein [Vicinamibacterales bacterium]
MTPVAKQTLHRFIEKANRLQEVSFFSRSIPVGAGVEFDSETRAWEQQFWGPDDEATEAVVLTLRFFIQDNEPISLRNMRALYERELPSHPLADSVEVACAGLNEWLDDRTSLSIAETRFLTYRDVLEIFVYGAYAHMNERRRKQFEDIRATPFFSLFRLNLLFTLQRLAQAVWAVRDASIEVMAVDASEGAV